MARQSSINSEMVIAKIYNLIKDAYNEKHYPPSIREMCSEVGLSSTSSVHRYLKIMADRGMIILAPGVNRGITLRVDDEEKKGEASETDKN